MSNEIEKVEKTDIEIYRDVMAKVRPMISVTKAVVTRSVKGARGDSYVGFSVAWNTIQDDSGGGGDLNANSDEVASTTAGVSGLSLKDAKLAVLVIGMQVDVAAHANAMAGGNISPDQYDDSRRIITDNYVKLIANAVRNGSK